MLTIRRGAAIRMGVALLVTLCVGLGVLVEGGQASTVHQTIPTAPPATSTAIAPSATPTELQQATVIATQPIQVTNTDTADITASATVESIATSATAVSIGTSVPSIGTTPTPLETLVATKASPAQATAAQAVTATAVAETRVTGSRWGVYCLSGAGVVLILVIGVVWYLRSRRR